MFNESNGKLVPVFLAHFLFLSFPDLLGLKTVLSESYNFMSVFVIFMPGSYKMVIQSYLDVSNSQVCDKIVRTIKEV